jgi:hypothetical protein
MNAIKFSRQRILITLAAAAFVSIAPALTHATVVYDTTGGATQAIDQQTGDNNYYIGDTATIVPTSEPLSTISIVFGSSSLAGPAFTYTPDLILDLYPTAANAAAGTGLFGTATVNNVTFTNDGVVGVAGYNYEDEQLVTFDFTSQNIVLPSSFAFAYHDTAPLDSNGSVNGANGFSVGLTAALASPGVSDQNYFYVYPNSPPPGLLEPQGVYNIEAQISVVPEPTSLSLIGLGSALLLRRRRRA